MKTATVINAPTMKDRIAGALFGMAYGDALAADVEFMSFPSIVKQFGPLGPQTLVGSPARVTDDTQMALAVGEALIDCAVDEYGDASNDIADPNRLPGYLAAHFVKWAKSPENNRAPGGTCMAACRAYETAPNQPWQRSTIVRSKGCGANMRVQYVAFLQDICPEDGDIAGIAQLQAAITHGHPTALCAADITQKAISLLAEGFDPEKLVGQLAWYAGTQSAVYHEAYLGDLWKIAGYDSPEAYIGFGWQEVIKALGAVGEAQQQFPLSLQIDPCSLTGEGWIAEEAFATALLCFLLYPNEPVLCIRRAATTNGDSDSIACIAGALAGAYNGIRAWPKDWKEQIEYRDRIEALVNFLS